MHLQKWIFRIHKRTDIFQFPYFYRTRLSDFKHVVAPYADMVLTRCWSVYIWTIIIKPQYSTRMRFGAKSFNIDREFGTEQLMFSWLICYNSFCKSCYSSHLHFVNSVSIYIGQVMTYWFLCSNQIMKLTLCQCCFCSFYWNV